MCSFDRCLFDRCSFDRCLFDRCMFDRCLVRSDKMRKVAGDIHEIESMRG